MSSLRSVKSTKSAKSAKHAKSAIEAITLLFNVPAEMAAKIADAGSD
jgi:hypothetical protein